MAAAVLGIALVCLCCHVQAECSSNVTTNGSCPVGADATFSDKIEALYAVPSDFLKQVRSFYPTAPDARTLTKGSSEYLELFKVETSFYNHVILDRLFPAQFVNSLPHFLQSWLRNYIGGIALYMVASTVWSVAVYNPVSASIFYTRGEALPAYHAMWLQIVVAMQAMPLYTALPTIIEYMVESGWTQAYSQIEEGGSPLLFAVRLFLYLLGVEFCIYWIHRSLHDYKILYQYLHAPHHIYNKGSTLSPYAGKDRWNLGPLFSELAHVNATSD